MLLSLLLTGCSGGLVKEKEVYSRWIVWNKQAPKDCGMSGKFNGCAKSTKLDCTITMAEDAPDHTVAEEFRHCFGYTHKK